MTPKKSYIYFIMGTKSSLVKIGKTTNLNIRLDSLQTASGEPLELFRCLRGGSAAEIWFHEKFSDLRESGEWFRYHSEMQSATPPPDVVDETTHSKKYFTGCKASPSYERFLQCVLERWKYGAGMHRDMRESGVEISEVTCRNWRSGRSSPDARVAFGIVDMFFPEKWGFISGWESEHE